MRAAVRSIFAFLAAALVPAAVILVPFALEIVLSGATHDPYAWVRFGRWVSLILTTSFVYVLVLGVPAFLLLRWRNAVRWWSAVLVGFVLGCLPVAISLWPESDSDLQTTASHWDGEKMMPTVIDGVPTLAGWFSYLQAVAFMGVFGAIGGLAFWLVWRNMRSNKPLEPTR